VFGSIPRIVKLALMAEPLVPRPAATVLTLRDGVEGYEILMLRRNIRSDFVGGAYVFPGGAVDAGDLGAASFAFGLSDALASRRLELEGGGLAYYVACLRELFEEAGLLLACDSSGGKVDPETRARLGEQRRALNARETDFASVLKVEELLLDLRGVEYLAHWITPVGPPRRYDTRFFVALAPSGQVAAHDAAETTAHRWLRPTDALNAHTRGEFEMILPTVRNLEAIADFGSAQEVLDYARSLTSIACVEPRIIERDGASVVLTPGDEGFERGT